MRLTMVIVEVGLTDYGFTAELRRRIAHKRGVNTAARWIWRGLRNNEQKPSKNRSSVERSGARRRTIDDEEFLLHMQAVGDEDSRTTGSK
jgi:hypothetical protein